LAQVKPVGRQLLAQHLHKLEGNASPEVSMWGGYDLDRLRTLNAGGAAENLLYYGLAAVLAHTTDGVTLLKKE
jgi:hypothetical protein